MKWPSLHCCSKTRDFIKGSLQEMSILCTAAVKGKTGLNKSLHWNMLSFPLTSAVNDLLSVTILKVVVVEESQWYFPAFPLSFSNLLSLSLCASTKAIFPEKLGSSRKAVVVQWMYWVAELNCLESWFGNLLVRRKSMAQAIETANLAFPCGYVSSESMTYYLI